MCDIIIVLLMCSASKKEFTFNVHKKLIKNNKNLNNTRCVWCYRKLNEYIYAL